MFKQSKVNSLRIASPCPISWDRMTGDERVRFCSHCELNVYNISELSRKEVEHLITSTEGRFCARLYRRLDGTILTKDCPVGLQMIKRRVSRVAAALFATLAGLCATVSGQTRSSSSCVQQLRIARKTFEPGKQSDVLTGVLTDQNGAVIPGAQIIVSRERPDRTQQSTSDAEGRFHLSTLDEGTYTLTFQAPGFKTYTIKNFTVEKNQSANIEVILQAQAEVLIGVVADDSPIDMSSSSKTTIISGEIIRRLPFE